MASQPIYQRIADDLRAKIASGALPPGTQLPTEAELAADHETSRETVRRGIDQLVNEGLVVSRRPRGHFVRGATPMLYRLQVPGQPRPLDVDIFTHLIASEGLGRQGHQEIGVLITQGRDRPQVQRRLGVADDEELAVRTRTRYIDGEPYNTEDSYVRLADVAGSEWISPADVSRGTNRVLVELGHELVRILDEIVIRMPTPTEVERLAIERGTPVAVHLATGYEATGRPAQVTVNCLPGDRHIIVNERHKDATQ